MWRLRRRKAEYPVLPRPLRRQIGEARNPHAVRESAVDSRFDEIGCEKGERDRHIHFADAAAPFEDLWSQQNGAGAMVRRIIPNEKT